MKSYLFPTIYFNKSNEIVIAHFLNGLKAQSLDYNYNLEIKTRQINSTIF